MNYLAHHAVARRKSPEADPLFFVGNLLPDLLALEERARLRAVHLPAPTETESPLIAGMRLHFAADRQFHAAPIFHSLCREAAERLRRTGFPTPLRRTFFLAHVLTEIALDGSLLRESPALADDLYDRLSDVDRVRVERELAPILPVSPLSPVSGSVSAILDRFVGYGWLRTYGSYPGQAAALRRIWQRAGLPGLRDPADLALLTDVLEEFAPRIRAATPELLGAEGGPD
ncbi:MAG: hypothetical protein SFU56_18510 [Capsulimonadales bacterium]|nr:hypothetical protein [Capsulimonadales bacterium]